MKNKFLIFMATITFFLTVAVVGILLKPELYESKTTVIKENDSMQSEVDEKNIESEVSNQEEWGSGDVYDGSSPIIRKMGEKLSVIGIPHRKQGDKPPMSTEVFAYWEGEMVFTVDAECSSFSKCKYVCKECGSSNEWTNSLGRGNNYSLDFQHMYAGWLFVFEKFGYYK